MSKVTYLLGAGASYGKVDASQNHISGVPIVRELPSAIDSLIHSLASEGDTFDKNSTAKKQLTLEQFNELLASLRNFKTYIENGDTIDHAIRSHYLLNTNDVRFGADYNQVYKFLKRMLSVCLLLLQDPKKYDQRYDTFLADILDNERHLPDMTVLSWNYDAQFEFAYAQYARNQRYILDLWDEINVYNKTCPTKYDSSKPFALIKINGTAFFRNHQFPTNQYKAAYEVEDLFFWKRHNVYQYIYEMVSRFYEGTTLSFAWENDEELKTIITERVKDTEELIIIGYSFPNYNEIYDTMALKAMPNLKRVVIQDTAEVFNEIKMKINDVLPDKNINFIHRPKYTEAFYVPYGISLKN